MRPRRFYGYYLTLSVGCIGAFSVWAHLPHRISERRAHHGAKACSAFVIDARRLPPVAAQTALLLSNSSGTVLFAHTENVKSRETNFHHFHNLKEAAPLVEQPGVSGLVTVHPISWRRASGYVLCAAEAAHLSDLEKNELIGGDEQVLLLTR